MWLFLFSSIACPSQDDELRVVHQPVGDRCGHSGGVEDLSPVSEGQVGGQQGRPLLVPCADYLEEEVEPFGPRERYPSSSQTSRSGD